MVLCITNNNNDHTKDYLKILLYLFQNDYVPTVQTQIDIDLSSNWSNTSILQTKNLESNTKQNNGLKSIEDGQLRLNSTILVTTTCLNKFVCDELKLKFLTSSQMPDKSYVIPCVYK